MNKTMLLLFLIVYRASIHETTSQSPASLMFGRELRLPCDLMFDCRPGEDLTGDYVSGLRRKLDGINEYVLHNIHDARDRMKDKYVNADRNDYQIDLVWLYSPNVNGACLRGFRNTGRGLSSKLQKYWEEQYENKADKWRTIYQK